MQQRLETERKEHIYGTTSAQDGDAGSTNTGAILRRLLTYLVPFRLAVGARSPS